MIASASWPPLLDGPGTEPRCQSRNEHCRRSIQDSIADSKSARGRIRTVRGVIQRCRQRVLAASADNRGRGEVEPSIAPKDLDHNPPVIPVENLRRVGCDDCFAGNGTIENAEGLPRGDDRVVVGIGVAAGDCLGEVVGITHCILVIDLVAAARVEPRFIDFDDISRSIDDPFDASRPARLPIFIDNRGHENNRGSQWRGDLLIGSHFEPESLGIEILEVAGTTGFGMVLNYGPAGERIREIAGVVRAPNGECREKDNQDGNPRGHKATPLGKRSRMRGHTLNGQEVQGGSSCSGDAFPNCQQFDRMR